MVPIKGRRLVSRLAHMGTVWRVRAMYDGPTSSSPIPRDRKISSPERKDRAMVSLLTSARVRPTRWGSAVCGAGLLLCLLGSPLQTRAAAGCRADPVVTLSNGATLDLNLAFTTSDGTLSGVQHIAYTLHGPKGTSLVSTSFPDGTGALSAVTYVADNTVGNYDGDTLVSTAVKVTVTAYMSVLTLPTTGGTPTPAAPAQGHSGQNLHIHFHIA